MLYRTLTIIPYDQHQPQNSMMSTLSVRVCECNYGFVLCWVLVGYLEHGQRGGVEVIC